MIRRLLWGLVFVLLLVNLAMIGSVLLPLSMTEQPTEVPGSGAVFGQETPDAYEVQFAYSIDGERHTTLYAVVNGTEVYSESYQDRTDRTAEAYQAAAGEPIYNRYASSDLDHGELQMVSRGTVVRNATDGDEAVVLTVERDSYQNRSTSVPYRVDGLAYALRTTTYQRERTDGSVDTYRPETGWFEAGPPYRITDASGEVRVDARTGTVRAANVTFDRTRDVSSYAEYLWKRDEAETIGIDLTLEAGEQHVEPPDWVESARQAAR